MLGVGGTDWKCPEGKCDDQENDGTIDNLESDILRWVNVSRRSWRSHGSGHYCIAKLVDSKS
jgi:hypothetical protein